MTMQDPIADMLTRIRNAHQAGKPAVLVALSKMSRAIAAVLFDEGYIKDVQEKKPEAGLSKRSGLHPQLCITLKYCDGKPVISKIKRVSRPALRIFRGKRDLPQVYGGMGVMIVSTSKGVMSANQAMALGVGGELICEVM